MHELTGKLPFAKGAAMVRSGQVTLRPQYKLLSDHGGILTVKVWWSAELSNLPSREITTLTKGPTDRMYSDATGLGAFARDGLARNSSRGHPILMTGKADALP